MNKRCILVGMGGHSKVVADVARKTGYDIVGWLDDHIPDREMPNYLGTLAEFERFAEEDIEFFIAIGNNAVRQRIAESLTLHGVRFATLVDPSAIIGSGVVIHTGTVVMPGVIVNADACVGQHAILNTGATVDHDCAIGAYAHVSPGAHLAGGVTVGDLAHVGIGANIIQQINIGTGAVIGAGAAVIRDIPTYATAVGVPAQVIKTHVPQKG
jgi:acetyltransferase EpsM